MAGRPVSIVGSRALAWVVRGEDIVLESGTISRGSPNVFAETAGVGRLGDQVTYQSTSGQVSGNVTRRSTANGRPMAVLGSTVTGPRIIKGWITSSTRTVYAD